MDELPLRGDQSLVLRQSGTESGVETSHELRRGSVGDAPERSENGARSRVLKGARETDEALTDQNAPPPRGAGRE